MRKCLAFLFLALSAYAFADESTMLTTPDSQVMAPRHGGKGKGSGKKKKSVDPQRMRGQCEILESPSDPFAGPCVTMPVEIMDATGKVEAVTRTGADGSFEFEIDPDALFALRASSTSFETVMPTKPVGPGPKVLRMQIRRKTKTAAKPAEPAAAPAPAAPAPQP